MGYQVRDVGGDMNLSLINLNQILRALEKTQEAKIRFTGELIAGQHHVSVRWETARDPRDSDQLVITGIRRV